MNTQNYFILDLNSNPLLNTLLQCNNIKFLQVWLHQSRKLECGAVNCIAFVGMYHFMSLAVVQLADLL